MDETSKEQIFVFFNYICIEIDIDWYISKSACLVTGYTTYCMMTQMMTYCTWMIYSMIASCILINLEVEVRNVQEHALL
jgi:hypothetical protein